MPCGAGCDTGVCLPRRKRASAAFGDRRRKTNIRLHEHARAVLRLCGGRLCPCLREGRGVYRHERSGRDKPCHRYRGRIYGFHTACRDNRQCAAFAAGHGCLSGNRYCRCHYADNKAQFYRQIRQSSCADTARGIPHCLGGKKRPGACGYTERYFHIGIEVYPGGSGGCRARSGKVLPEPDLRRRAYQQKRTPRYLRGRRRYRLRSIRAHKGACGYTFLPGRFHRNGYRRVRRHGHTLLRRYGYG